MHKVLNLTCNDNSAMHTDKPELCMILYGCGLPRARGDRYLACINIDGFSKPKA